MSGESSAVQDTVGDVLSKIGKAVSEGAESDGPPELVLTQDMRVWDSVSMAAARAAAPAMDEAKMRALVEETVLSAIASNEEIGALIRKAARPSASDIEDAVRSAVAPLVEREVSERLGELRQAVLSSVTDQLAAQHAEAQAALEQADDVRKKQARKAVRAELKALLASLDDDKG